MTGVFSSRASEPNLVELECIIAHAAHLLPAQGPIPVFIHHNTLHAFEDLPFTEAVKKASGIFGCQPYLSEDRYHEEFERGRIRFGDLVSVVREDLGSRADEKIFPFLRRSDLRLAMLHYPLRYGPGEELAWFIAETDALRKIRSDAASAVRTRLIAETRHWAMRDLRTGLAPGTSAPASSNGQHPERAALLALVYHFGESAMETWSEATWEAFTVQALWRVCCEGIRRLEAMSGSSSHAPLGSTNESAARGTPQDDVDQRRLRHRDLLLEVTGADSDLLVQNLLIGFCGAFLDQGLAQWQLPGRDQGFYRAFCTLYAEPGGPPEPWRAGLAKELRRMIADDIRPLDSIRESLRVLGVAGDEWENFLSTTLLALRGWAGITRFLEERPDRAVHAVPDGSLIEFLAIRLLLDRFAVAHTALETLGYTGPLSSLRQELLSRIDSPSASTVAQRAVLVFQLAQVIGWTADELNRLSAAEWHTLLVEIESFSAIERRRTLHLAYERRFYNKFLDAVTLHNRRQCVAGASAVAELARVRENLNSGEFSYMRLSPGLLGFQAIFCIDERAESIRRHLEEVAPDAETYGIPGFYFLDMYYKGADDAHFVPLCPPVICPGHWVIEKVVEGFKEDYERRSKARRVFGLAAHHIHAGSRTMARGAVLAAVIGVFATIPLVARTLFPRLAARIRKMFGQVILTPTRTRLHLERTGPTPGPEGTGIGFSVEEMVHVAERVLRDTGLISGFSRLVLTFGHGSTSMNNPHESAHDCGACGGARGGTNGRAIAEILNDARVRERLQERGIIIPPFTVFVGGKHNTSNEAVTFYDLDCLPESHREEFEAVRAKIEEACDRDAHERCRRFASAPLTLTFAEARRHVEGRAEDLAQVRPEWGHATNAACVVGRRQRTRGLFLDRRAFLVSYDPTQDDAEAKILTRILQAAVPVCAGISLEYYFSYVDNPGYGCGTKVPHNIASLLGVMDGATSDLRTGLPWQMVEIHEPVRVLFLIETTADKMLRILERNPIIGRLIRNGWVQLAVLDPHSPAIQRYHRGTFREYHPESDRLPEVPSSVDWYRGAREHLEFAEIVR